MKRNKMSLLKSAALLATGVFLAHGAQATTRITGNGFAANNIDLNSIPGFGSFVNATGPNWLATVGVNGFLGTPNINTTWGAGYQTYLSWDSRGNVIQTDYNTATNSAGIDITWTPDPGYGVLVTRFDLDEWGGAGTAYGAAFGDANVSWSLTDAFGTLASGVWDLRNNLNDPGDAGGRDIILTGLTAGSVNIGQAVTLRLTFNSGAPSYLAMDNLTFDQIAAVPEPTVATIGLLGAGLGAMAMRRRKQA
jgi:hypothetical protein